MNSFEFLGLGYEQMQYIITVSQDGFDGLNLPGQTEHKFFRAPNVGFIKKLRVSG